MVTEADPYADWPLSDRLKMLAFETGLRNYRAR
jgi:hypothetical protein